MKILLAPDSFKGSLSAVEVCRAMAEGVRRVFPAAVIEEVPLADGGEGTLDALLAATGGMRKEAWVQGPNGRDVRAAYGLLPDGRAIIEMAQASGLTLVPGGERNAETATTHGTGQLIKAALADGSRSILLALGGSATTDGGTGALTALGAHFRDRNRVVLGPGGSALRDLAAIDLRFMDPRVEKTTFTVLCDVTNPLTGPDGAAAVYGPQKGASPEAVERLDAGLAQLARVAHKQVKGRPENNPGAGAAGGTAYGFMAFCGALVQSGIEAVLESTEFEKRLENCDLLLTGEGCLDHQTLAGKTVAGVTALARRIRPGMPILGIGGALRLTGEQMDHLGLTSAFSLADGPRSLEECLESAHGLTAAAVERALRLWRHSSHRTM